MGEGGGVHLIGVGQARKCRRWIHIGHRSGGRNGGVEVMVVSTTGAAAVLGRGAGVVFAVGQRGRLSARVVAVVGRRVDQPMYEEVARVDRGAGVHAHCRPLCENR